MGALGWLATLAWVAMVGLWVVCVYCMLQMLRHRSPHADRRAFTGAAHEFTVEGLRYRRGCFVAGCLFVALVAAGVVITSLGE